MPVSVRKDCRPGHHVIINQTHISNFFSVFSQNEKDGTYRSDDNHLPIICHVVCRACLAVFMADVPTLTRLATEHSSSSARGPTFLQMKKHCRLTADC